jgi:metacaspase-1
VRNRYALCVGINDYPGVASDLSGCVNDALDWRDTLLGFGYDVHIMLDAEVGKVNLVESIKERLSHLRAGDRFVLTFSGHGTWAPDKSGDEIDRRDEALCCVDYESGGLLTDDEMFLLFTHRKFGSRVTVLSDSCHSGTVSRFMADRDVEKTVKFVSPSRFTDMSETAAARAEAFLPGGKPRSDAVLISGCMDHEYSYDANFDGRPNGAFTYFMREAIAKASSQRTENVYDCLRTKLPIPQYPQTPQLTAGLYQRRSSLL